MTERKQNRLALLHANADHGTGMGHVMRSLAGAEEIRSLGWQLKFVGNVTDSAEALIRETVKDIEVIRLSDGYSDQELKGEILRLAPDLLSVDSYSETADSLMELGIPMGNFSDGPFGRRPASITIDTSWKAQNDATVIPGNVDSLLGPEYAQIRRSVRAQAGEWTKERSIKRVFVVLGGTDPANWTELVCLGLLKAKKDLHLTAITSAEKHAGIRELAGEDSLRLKLLGFTDRLPELVAQTDMVVTAAGTSVFDFMCMGIPQAVICTADNQLPGYRSYLAEDLVFGLGDSSRAYLDEGISRLVSEMEDPQHLVDRARRAKEKVDGLGALRLAQRYDALVKEGKH